MVEAGHRPSVERHAVGAGGRVEQGHVTGVGHHTGMEQRVVREAAVGPHPDLQPGGAGGQAGGTLRRGQVSHVDGPGPIEVHQLTGGRRPLGEGGQGVGLGDERHRRLVGHPLLGDLERRRQVEDGPPVLDGHDPTGAEGSPVAEAVDLVEDRGVGIPWAEKVGVQRVHGAVAAG